MPGPIDYYISLISPWTFLGHERLVALAAARGVPIAIHPVDLLSVFEQSGGLPLAKRPPARRAYRMQELERWREALDVPLTLEPAHFPADETQAALLTIAAREEGRDAVGLAGRFMRAVWMEERNIADPATIDLIVHEAGEDPDALRAAAERHDAAAIRRNETAEAIGRGVFGAPTYFVGKAQFWGQDRLDFVERALTAG